MINITLKDNTIITAEQGSSVYDIAKKISGSLAKEALVGEIDGKAADLTTKIEKDCSLNILTFEDKGGRDAFWHTSSHVLAQAVKRIFPNVRLAIGPAIDNGFYYDFDIDKTFVPEDLDKITEEMKKIIKENYQPKRMELSKEEAVKYFEDKGEIYKVELAEVIKDGEKISFYEQGEFTDLCAGPHLFDLSKIKAVKLTSIAGAYWRGDEKNKMLQRIYGISFPKQSMLDEYLEMIEEAKKRDHRKLGKELDLYSIMEEGPGFPFFHPNGMILRNELEYFWRCEHTKRGYSEVRTPIMLDCELWKQSGHWQNYKDNMYFSVIDEKTYALKPMNCPGSMLLYKRKMWSYRDLPLKMGELGIVHRHELSGALHGLMRVRNFTQDDAHIFITAEQITDEIVGVMEKIDYFYSLFGFSYHVELSTRPEKFIGEIKDWDIATDALKAALDKKGKKYVINEGDGAFYGPKIDFHLKDSIGRTWQCGTIQLDFQMPERFDLSYVGADGEKHRPIVIHTVTYGSIERFIAILTEHFAGAFPLWLAPLQCVVIPVASEFDGYCKKILQTYKDCGIRAEYDDRNEKMGYKIREAQMRKIPYMLVVGQKEQDSNTVAVRSRKGDNVTYDAAEFLAKLKEEINNKSY
ncbi:MAG: threonine--tRNA ligase [Eubacteriaceae bacterium]|nr:threonine--tRNA ligase [Eubacteriaceae bacterium]